MEEGVDEEGKMLGKQNQPKGEPEAGLSSVWGDYTHFPIFTNIYLRK